MRSFYSSSRSSSPSTFSIDDILLPDFQSDYQYTPKKETSYKAPLLPLILHLREAEEDTILICLSYSSKHFPHLLHLFPRLRIHSYYSKEKLTRSPRVEYYKSFTLERAKSYNRNVFFYVENIPMEIKKVLTYYEKRLELIQLFYKYLQPRYALIKFSLPYPGLGAKALKFLDGTLIVPPYTDRSWTFLIPNGLTTYWNIREYDRRISYSHQVLRNKLYLLGSTTVDYNSAYLAYVLGSLLTCKASRFSGKKIVDINTKVLEKQNRHDKEDSQNRG